MKKIAVFLIVVFSFCYGQIIEVKTIKEVTKKLKNYDLILFDLDNTIMEPTQQLGSDQWFYHHMKQYEMDGLDLQKALDRTLDDWHEIQAITKVKLVEKTIKNLIDNLQNKNVFVMGLTTRGVELSIPTIKQLDSLNIDLLKTAPKKDKLYFDKGYFYNRGILFANGMNKGKALKHFFKKIGFSPKSIIFIDDKEKHLIEVQNYCSGLKIKFLGFRYGYLDKKIKCFDKTICDIQHKNIKNILSDKEAKKMLK